MSDVIKSSFVGTRVGFGPDLGPTTTSVLRPDQDAWARAMTDAGLGAGGFGDDGGRGDLGGAGGGAGGGTSDIAEMAVALTAVAGRSDTGPNGPFRLASDTTGQRYPVPAPPFSRFSPVSPESRNFATEAGKGLKAVGDAIKGPLGDREQEEAADGTNKPAGTSGATAAAGATPPEDPDDPKQQRFRAKVDRDLNEIQETTDNASYRHLKDSDLDGARRELNNEVVSRRAGGKPYDHVNEVITGQRSLMRGILRIKSLMERVPVNTPQYARMERMLGDLSNKLDYSHNFVPRGTVSPSNPDLISP